MDPVGNRSGLNISGRRSGCPPRSLRALLLLAVRIRLDFVFRVRRLPFRTRPWLLRNP